MKTNTKEKSKKRLALKITGIAAAVIILAVAVVLPILYNGGNLSRAFFFDKAKSGELRVACIGDSITYGAGVKGWTKNSYPVVLDELLGEGYCVNNYGYSGRTAMYDGDYPYAEEGLYKKSLAFAPDIVVIMFGTNDSKPYNWKGREKFIEDYGKLIDNYLSLDSHPTVYVIAPPPCFPVNGKVGFDIDAVIIKNDVCPATAALAEQKGVQLIDMYSSFDGRRELLSDGVHPNVDGAKLFANTVCNAIK